MKKTGLILLLIAAAVLLSSCGAGTAQNTAPQQEKTISAIPVLLDQSEYLLYQNVFYNNYGPQFEGQQTIKKGVLGKIRDAFNGRDRYYVWGYLDNTMCCDWQWEIVPADAAQLPPVGSMVRATGTFRADEAALDGYWISGAKVETLERYTGPQEELNMQAMSCTLERVQMLNILHRSEEFEGRAFLAYGRIAAVDVLEDPYYSSWQIPFQSDTACPAIGTMVDLQGKVAGGMLTECSLKVR